MGTLKDDLRAAGFEVVETHVSWVFLGPGEVYKIKKPVFLGFLDFRSADRRRVACDAEVVLNRRLAPEVYLGVVPVTRDQDGKYRIGGTGLTVDWAVHMRRLDEASRADALLAQGKLTPKHLDQLAEALAAFHRSARSDEETASFGRTETISVNVRENFEQTRTNVVDYLSGAEAHEIEAWQIDFLQTHADRFEERRGSGRVRDGHGDLRLEHVYFPNGGPPIVVDCIEFNERFRFADVCADVAFLSMDLAWHQRADYAERFLAAYARAANDYELYPLVDFYESYRAYVRGKVASMLASDEGAEVAARERARSEARRYYLLALASERRSLLPPILVAVGGVIASGKSTVAEQMATLLGAPIVDSDRTRKFLRHVAPETPIAEAAWTGAYSASQTAEVYAEVFRRAGAVLASGRPVVVDASFRAKAERTGAREIAGACGVPFLFVECRAAPAVGRERLRQRESKPGVSDGRLEIFEQFLASWEPADEVPDSRRIILDTTRPIEENLAVLRRGLATWPAALTG